MGYEYSMNVFICGNLTAGENGILKNVISKLFTQKGDKSYTKFEPRKYDFDIYFSYNRPLEDYKFYWIGHLFKDRLSPLLIENIGSGIQKMNKRYIEEESHKIDIRRNNVILCFLKDDEDGKIIEDTINNMNNKIPATLTESNNPIIVTIGGKNIDRDYEKIKPFNRLPGGSNDDILRNVHSKLLTIDAYLNERGNIFDKIVYRNLGKHNLVTASTSLDILIYGGPRSGKSTFINILSNSLLAREQTNAETCTTKCTEYIIPFDNVEDNIENNNNNLENLALEQINRFTGNLKIIDTPGLFEKNDNSKVCECIKNYIKEEVEIIQLALFFMKDTTTLGKSKEVLKLLIKNNIPIFFVQTHAIDKNIKFEQSGIYKDIISFISNSFGEDAGKLLIHRGENEIYNIIRINQKVDEEHKTIFGVDILIEKILHFFLYEKIDSLLKNNLKEEQSFYDQRNILSSCLSDLSVNYLNFSLHNLLFRKFLTLANVSEYYYLKSIAIVTTYVFACSGSCSIPIPFADLPLYYALHYSMIEIILSVFGIKFNEIDIKTIMTTNGTNLGGTHRSQSTIFQIFNVGIKAVLSLGKLGSDASEFIPFLGIAGIGADVAFSSIDTSILGHNLIRTCNKLPKQQQFFKNELEKFYYILHKIDEIKKRITNEYHHN